MVSPARRPGSATSPPLVSDYSLVIRHAIIVRLPPFVIPSPFVRFQVLTKAQVIIEGAVKQSKDEATIQVRVESVLVSFGPVLPRREQKSDRFSAGLN